MTEDNADEDVGAMTFGLRYAIGNESTVFPQAEAMMHKLPGGLVQWQFTVVKGLPDMATDAPFFGILENILDEATLSSKLNQNCAIMKLHGQGEFNEA